MFISRPKPKPSNIGDPKLKRSIEKLRAMFIHGTNWPVDPRRTNNVNREYARRSEAAKKIQRLFRRSKVINRAKASAPHTRTINNPIWKAFFNYQMALTLLPPPRKKSHQQLPKINRRFGLWFNHGNYWLSPNGRMKYFPKTNTLNGHTNAFKKFTLPNRFR